MLASTPLTHIPLLFDTLLTLVLFTLGAALGLRLLRWLRISVADTLERGVFAATLGMGALSFLPFVLFAVGIGRPVVVMSAVVLLVLLLWKDALRIVRGAVGLLSKTFRDASSGFSWGWLPALAAAPQLLTLFLQALCPPTDPDGLFYHLTGPLRYLDLGHFAYMPTFLQLNWPLGVEMLFGIGMAFNTNYAA
ncbi:MAG: family glycosyltransferase, 4-amino-4-deoxy-L-arabinose transferase, partial [Chthonomonadales bacterium]|nr:family glycosyltransferase, 4-amino-4-deoxy-L-arabinose transferase [Chthonomonadales bacterium]